MNLNPLVLGRNSVILLVDGRTGKRKILVLNFEN